MEGRRCKKKARLEPATTEFISTAQAVPFTNKLMDFEAMCEKAQAYCSRTRTALPMSPEHVEDGPLEEVLVEAARRLTSDPFFRALGQRLFEDYTVVRWTSQSLFAWLFEGEARPCFLSDY